MALFGFICALGSVIVILLTSLILSGELPKETVTWFWFGCLAVCLFGVGLALFLYGTMGVLFEVETHGEKTRDAIIRLGKYIDQTNSELEQIRENLLLSEDIKTTVYRYKELEAIQSVIDRHVNLQKFDEALQLTDLLEQRFGMAAEAQELRVRVNQLRREKQNQELAIMIAKLHDLLAAYSWEEAQAQVAEIQRAFPGHDEVAKLPEVVEKAISERKKALLEQWDESVRKNQVDRGMTLLRELDGYLTPNEVAALQESARDVVKARLHQLGVQFSLLVNEKMWEKALEVGQEIVREFPNSRMAQEIRERVDVLRAKAAGRKPEKAV